MAKLSVSYVDADFSHFYLGIFLLGDFLFENFLSVQLSIETLKKVVTVVW